MSENNKKPLVILTGPTGVGKTELSIKLAKTSNTPGKTRLINFFDFSGKFMIADLPGYGYAKVSKEAQNKWQKYLEEYLLKREEICSLVQLIDGRHDIQKNDYQSYSELGRGISDYTPILHSMIIIPALTHVFEILKSDIETFHTYEDKRWFKALSKKFDALNKKFDYDELKNQDSLSLAQEIIECPIEMRIKSNR